MTVSQGVNRSFLLSLVFAVFTAVMLVKFTSYYTAAMIGVIITGLALWFTVTGVRYVMISLFALLPVSMNMDIGAGANIMMPSELLIMVLALSVIFTWLRTPLMFNGLLRSKVTILFASYLAITVVSVIFSEMMMVSVKAVVVKLLYAIALFAGSYLYTKQGNSILILYKSYSLVLSVIIIWIMWQHYNFDFSKDVTGYITKPFYNDHTIYSSVLAFLIPFLFLIIVRKTGGAKYFYAGLFLLFISGLILAFSRAAWLSVAAMVAMYIVLALKIRMKWILFGVVLVLGFVVFNFGEVESLLRFNKYDSNARNAGFEEQTRSVVNISNDQSNAERINRWKCAVRMFKTKPLTGFGPGTYQFTYLPFQRDYEMTRISVTSPYLIKEGRGGTAHNELLLALSESGILAVSFLLLTILAVFFAGEQQLIRSGNHTPVILSCILALTSYFFHSFFNNFLDTDKAAALVFSAIGFIVAAGSSDR